MDFYSFGPIAAVLDAAYRLVTFLGDVLAPVAGTASAALAIVVLTVLVRAALIPVGISQVRAEQTRQRLAPQLRELNARYGSDRESLQRETMALYAREKASPFAGCLPLLAQAPVLSIVYALFLHATIAGHGNALLTQHLFGVPLGTSFVHLLGAGALWPGLPVFAALLGLLTGVVAVSRRVLPAGAASTSGVAIRAEPVNAGPADAAIGRPAGSVTRALSYLPFVTVVFAAFVPLAAGLYLVTTTSWTVCERVLLRRACRPAV